MKIPDGSHEMMYACRQRLMDIGWADQYEQAADRPDCEYGALARACKRGEISSLLPI